MATKRVQTIEFFKKRAKSCCTVKNVNKRLPITAWLPKYTTEDLVGDLIAGFTVGLTMVPQGIAYAHIAGLPPNYGLYSSFMSSFMFVIFGSVKQTSIGPTAIVSLLTYEYSREGNPDIANLLCFTSGVLTLLFGILNLGFLIAFLSKPVISGFTSAAAILIISAQLKGLFGIKVKTKGLLDTWIKVFGNLGETNLPDLVLGLIAIIFLLVMKKIRELERFKPKSDDTMSQKVIKKFVFFFSVGRNAVAVIIATIIARLLHNDQPFTITGEITPGLPSFQLPSFSTNNGTTSFMEIMADAGTGILVIPLISILENIAIGSSFSQGKTIDATQEIIALGMCNLASSFFQSIPNAGAFSRSAVNDSSGVRTTGGGIVTGAVVILALAVLTPYFTYIPRPALAAVIICSTIFMIKYQDIVPIWRVRKVDEFVLWVSLLVCLFWKLEYGILLGAFVNLAISIFNFSSPKVQIVAYFEDGATIPPHIIVQPRLGVMYFNVDTIRNHITKAGLREAKGVFPVVVDCCHFSVIDYSGSKGINSLCTDYARRKQAIIFMNASPGVARALRALDKNIKIIDQGSLLDTLKSVPCQGACALVNTKPIEENKLLFCRNEELKNAIPMQDV